MTFRCMGVISFYQPQLRASANALCISQPLYRLCHLRERSTVRRKQRSKGEQFSAKSRELFNSKSRTCLSRVQNTLHTILFAVDS